MVGTTRLLLLAAAALLLFTSECASQCGYQESCILAAECRRSLVAAGLSGDLSQLHNCGFSGNFPKLCCPAQSGRPASPSALVYPTAQPTTSSTARTTTVVHRPPAYAQNAGSFAATQRPAQASAAAAATTTARPQQQHQKSSSARPTASTARTTQRTTLTTEYYVQQPASAPVYSSSNTYGKPLVLSNNRTDVRITEPNPAGPASSSSSYPGTNSVNSGYSGPVSSVQQAVLEAGAKPKGPKDLMQHHNLRLLPVDRCGRNAAETNERIRGYQRASLGEFPWVAMLGEKRGEHFRHICGGSVISKRYVLTAAHCITPQITLVRLGEQNTLTEPDCNADDCADSVLDIEISEKIRHPRYNKPGYEQNDIGLVRLKRSLPHLFTSYIRPVCIPLRQEIQMEERRTRLITVGWGLTVSKPNSNELQAAELPLITNRLCGSLQVKLRKDISESQLCANSSDYVSTACQGDTGGPLMLLTHGYRAQSETPVYMQVGVLSHGPDDCGYQGAPAIFTRVSAFAEWILDTIHE